MKYIGLINFYKPQCLFKSAESVVPEDEEENNIEISLKVADEKPAECVHDGNNFI